MYELIGFKQNNNEKYFIKEGKLLYSLREEGKSLVNMDKEIESVKIFEKDTGELRYSYYSSD